MCTGIVPDLKAAGRLEKPGPGNEGCYAFISYRRMDKAENGRLYGNAEV